MSSDAPPTTSEGTGDPQDLSALLRSVPGGAEVAERVMAELADVQVAHEELRVAEEEMRTQHEQITQLLLQHDAELRWRGRVAAMVPQPMGAWSCFCCASFFCWASLSICPMVSRALRARALSEWAGIRGDFAIGWLL